MRFVLMWKFSFRRTLFEWVKPPAKEGTKKSELSKCIPCVQVEPQKSLLFRPNNQQHHEEKEKEKRHTCHSFPKLCSGIFLETFGWVGTAFFIGLHLRDHCWKKHRALQYTRDVSESPQKNHILCSQLCERLLPLAFNMQSSKHRLIHNNHLEAPLPVQETRQESASECDNTEQTKKEEYEDISKVCQAIASVTVEYFGQLENFAGVSTRNKKAAYLHFRNGVKYGCSSSHFNIGVCYETGHGTRVDFIKAAEHYRIASNAGHNLAKYNLGVYYLEGKGGLPVDDAMGLELISQAAEQGVLQAQTYMGIHFIEQQDWSKALTYLKEASKLDPEAKYYLGMCYENGWGMKSNNQEAKQLYHEAAANGNSEAITALASLSEKEKSKEASTIVESKRINSVPELVLLNKENEEKPVRAEISRYLDIIFPEMWKKPSKASFWVNESDEVLTLKNELSMHNQVVLPGVDVVGTV